MSSLSCLQVRLVAETDAAATFCLVALLGFSFHTWCGFGVGLGLSLIGPLKLCVGKDTRQVFLEGVETVPEQATS